MSAMACVFSVLICTVWAGLLQVGTAAQDGPFTAELKIARRAKSPVRLAEAYLNVFPKASSVDVHQMMNDSHCGVALRAAWERVRRTIGEEFRQEAAKPDSASLNRFLGFVEGRLNTGVPSLWESTFSRVRAYRRSEFFFPCEVKQLQYHKTELGVAAPRDMSLKRIDGEVLVAIGKQSCQIPVTFMQSDKSEYPVDAACSLFTDTRCYVAFHSDKCVPYRLRCFDRASKKCLWTARVWAAGGLAQYTGIGYHLVALKEENEKLLVFGIGIDAAYIEGFNRKNGEDAFHFCTSYGE